MNCGGDVVRIISTCIWRPHIYEGSSKFQAWLGPGTKSQEIFTSVLILTFFFPVS